MSALERVLRPWLSYVMHEWLVYQTVGSVLAIFPTALLMGIAFPIGLRLWTSGGRDGDSRLAERLGVFYSLNVAGSILGSLAAGFILLPFLGSRQSLIVLATLSFGSGLVLLAVFGVDSRTVRLMVGGAAALVFVLALRGLERSLRSVLVSAIWQVRSWCGARKASKRRRPFTRPATGKCR